MAMHPDVLERVRMELEESGFGAGSAALLGGRSSAHHSFETSISKFTGFETALLFSSGYLANLGTLGALIKKNDWVFHDKLNHASLIDGVLATGCKHKRYPHLSFPNLQKIKGYKNTAIVTESIFSMDGDVADINTLNSIATEEKMLLYVDDAHGFGVSENGRGTAAIFNHKSRTDNLVIMVTLGKALGSFGGVILSSAKMRDFLINHSRTFIYDTAIPPAAAAAASEALKLIASDEKPYKKLHNNIKYFRKIAKEAKINLKESISPIQPILFKSEQLAIDKETRLRQNGFYVKAIRPPTVPTGTSRIRVVLNSLHTYSQLEKLVGLLAKK